MGLEKASSSTSFNTKEVKSLNNLLDVITNMLGVRLKSKFLYHNVPLASPSW